MLTCAAVNFATFFVVGILPSIPIFTSNVTLDTLGYEEFSHLSADQLVSAEAAYSPLGEFTRWGVMGLPVAYSILLGLHSALYGCIGMCLALLQRNRVVTLLVPWGAWMGFGLVFAWLGLEAYSPLLVDPFNLSHVPLWCFAMSFLVPAMLLGLLSWQVMMRMDSLDGCV